MPFFSQDQVDRLAGREVRSAWAAEMQFRSETSRVWAGETILEANGNEWKPSYGAVQIEGLGWNGEAASKQISLRVSGVDSQFLQLARGGTSEADQQPMIVYLVFFDDDWQFIEPMVSLGIWLMQPPKVSRTAIDGLDGAEQSVTLTAENLFYNRARPANGRYTPADQARRVGWNDKFFNFIPGLIDKKIRWPVF